MGLAQSVAFLGAYIMADWRVWARVEQIGARQFLAVASAVPDPPTDKAIVLTAIAPSLAEANGHKARLMVEMGARVRAGGDRVVDVED